MQLPKDAAWFQMLGFIKPYLLYSISGPKGQIMRCSVKKAVTSKKERPSR